MLIIREDAFGHVGMGGSVGFADPEAEPSFGYTMNRLGAGILLNARGQVRVDTARLAECGRAPGASKTLGIRKALTDGRARSILMPRAFSA